MSAVRGRVRDGRVELETTLPDGTEVVVLEVNREPPFELPEDQILELERRIARAEQGDVVPAVELLRSLRATR